MACVMVETSYCPDSYNLFKVVRSFFARRRPALWSKSKIRITPYPRDPGGGNGWVLVGVLSIFDFGLGSSQRGRLWTFVRHAPFLCHGATYDGKGTLSTLSTFGT